MEPVASLARSYSRMAIDYRDLWAPTLLPFGRALLDQLPLADARRVLDLGAGVGTLEPEIAARTGGAVVAADRAIGMLRLADDARPRTVLDATRLPFRERTFDVVVMAFMLFHVPEPRHALEEVRRALTPSGVAGTATWGGGSEAFPAMDLWNEAIDAVAPELEEAVPDSSEATNTREAIEQLFEDAGFTAVETEELPFENAFTHESFLENRLKIGRSRRLVEALPDDVRERLVDEMRSKLAALQPADLVDHDTVILAHGTAT